MSRSYPSPIAWRIPQRARRQRLQRTLWHIFHHYPEWAARCCVRHEISNLFRRAVWDAGKVHNDVQVVGARIKTLHVRVDRTPMDHPPFGQTFNSVRLTTCNVYMTCNWAGENNKWMQTLAVRRASLYIVVRGRKCAADVEGVWHRLRLQYVFQSMQANVSPLWNLRSWQHRQCEHTVPRRCCISAGHVLCD